MIVLLCWEEGGGGKRPPGVHLNNWASTGAARRWGALVWENISRSVLDMLEHL